MKSHSARGKIGKGKPKTMTPAAMKARRDNVKKAIAKRWFKFHLTGWAIGNNRCGAYFRSLMPTAAQAIAAHESGKGVGWSQCVKNGDYLFKARQAPRK